ncbi:MAG: 5-(carboxyamino)imidazole ribonucleotide synthase [Acidimicrobiales bacterium]
MPRSAGADRPRSVIADPEPNPRRPGRTPAATPPRAPVAVIGGGQLARMLQPAAVALGIPLRLLATSPEESAAQVITDVVIGNHTDPAAVAAVADGARVITFDHEHVPPEVLAAVAAGGVEAQPPAAALVHAQDKVIMRTRMDEVLPDDPRVGQPRWTVANDLAGVDRFMAELDGPVVVKTPRGGYDGRGVLFLDRPVGTGTAPSGPGDAPAGRDVVGDWLTRFPGGLLVEAAVPFVRELAVLVARTPSGRTAAWPVVETVQVDGMCAEVIAPAPGLDPDLARAASAAAVGIADALGVTGVVAVEGFETADGRFLVNELAMRPHNSGHWTIEGAVTSQFEQHLRAVLDLPLGDPGARAPWSVMVNVIGRHDDRDPFHRSAVAMAADPGAKIHAYGKTPRRGRKLGHVTVAGDDLDRVRARARAAVARLHDEPEPDR